MNNKAIAYIQGDKWGYSVEIRNQAGEIVKEYDAGNHIHDSQGYTENPSYMVDCETLGKSDGQRFLMAY